MKNTKLFLLLILVALMFALAACGGSDDAPPTIEVTPIGVPTATPIPGEDAYVWVPVAVTQDNQVEPVETETEEVADATATPAANEEMVENEETDLEIADACPQDADMVERALANGYVHFTFDGEEVAWDPCKWHGYTEDGLTLVDEDWQATVVVHHGEEQSDPIVWRGPTTIDGNVSFTLRYIGEDSGYSRNHWVHKDCELMIQEYAFGIRREEWDYGTYEGNVSCPKLNALLKGEFDINDLPNVFTVAAIFGGESTMWVEKDWEGGAHVFAAGEHENGELNYVVLEIPSWASTCYITYWNNSTGPDKLLPGEPGIGLNKASLHCHSD